MRRLWMPPMKSATPHERLAADRHDRRHEQQAGELRPEHHRDHGHAPALDAADEVGYAPREARREPECDRDHGVAG
jgi:hypothetical protein